MHLLAVPATANALAQCIGLAHQRYADDINARHGWTGNLWANRFYSSPLDEDHLWKVARYIELNPVRAGLAAEAQAWQWSSARCHAGLAIDGLLADGRPIPGQWSGNWPAFLEQRLTAQEMEWIRQNLATGRLTGSREFVEVVEKQTARILTPQKRGPKSSSAAQVISLTEDMFG